MTHKKDGDTQPPQPEASLGDLVIGESKAWRKMLSSFSIPIKPPPAYLNPDLIANLQQDGFIIRYLPALILGDVGWIKSSGTYSFLTALAGRYPGWKIPEVLETEERYNPIVARNLNTRYWEYVKDGRANFPQLPGEWLAVQAKIPDKQLGKSPPRGEYIKQEETIPGTTNAILSCSGLDLTPYLSKATLTTLPPNTTGRLLEPLEWNLLANREEWGSQREHTNTAYFSGNRAIQDEWTFIVGGGYPGTDLCEHSYYIPSEGPKGYRVVVSLNGNQ